MPSDLHNDRRAHLCTSQSVLIESQLSSTFTEVVYAVLCTAVRMCKRTLLRGKFP